MNLQEIVTGLPFADIEKAIAEPTDLGSVAKVAEDAITLAMPGLSGAMISVLVQLFVVWVYAEGGGTITPDPLPMTDAQTSLGRGGRR
jgi:hypothetical protein